VCLFSKGAWSRSIWHNVKESPGWFIGKTRFERYYYGEGRKRKSGEAQQDRWAKSSKRSTTMWTQKSPALFEKVQDTLTRLWAVLVAKIFTKMGRGGQFQASFSFGEASLWNQVFDWQTETTHKQNCHATSLLDC